MSFVVVELNGGLGNQLFQYAAARALAERHGGRVLFDVSAFKKDEKRQFELDKFRIDGTALENGEITELYRESLRASGTFGRLVSTMRGIAGIRKYKETRFDYDVVFERLKLPVRLIGYWQSEKYFLSIKSQLLNELLPVSAPDQENAILLKAMADENSVSVHVRRGDYAADPKINKVHGLCDLDYYRRALELIGRRVSNPVYYVFSDDPEWVSENLDIGCKYRIISHNIGKEAYWDMHLMRSCRHNIIANSTFSWWGAWLNASTEKVVVAPRHWFRDSRINTKDLLPQGWSVT